MKPTKIINIAADFTDAPGARYKSDGPFSGEAFYEKLLLPAYIETVRDNGLLLVDLDDTWGYASSFISGSFGKLSQKYGAADVLKHIKFKSDDSPALILKVENEIRNPIKNK
ncbi:hypothetical protein GCM10011375_06260 [Hymenobacter qilianensis]|uniref:Uncharacterized protein n=2 Tax=Hymenobacter qilianensis TaxID=1385715 RepID=A0ACB5PML7_9BACT|nr:STAS-like domain-containing protein [Hymenobacter qilianensis]QNP53730.1 STAS-like domain-containing protein [Hymenobacter qilianensis]GGF53489.1 hypothetical protein GCM10011375_06260 [Hymenobacter qilianensis]